MANTAPKTPDLSGKKKPYGSLTPFAEPQWYRVSLVHLKIVPLARCARPNAGELTLSCTPVT